MSVERKRLVLKLEHNLTWGIVERLKTGEYASDLANVYNVGRLTIRNIKSSEIKLLNFQQKLGNENNFRSCKNLKIASDDKLDDAMYK